MTTTLADAIARHGVEVEEHLDRDEVIPVLSGMQRQGDVIVIPQRVDASSGEPVGAEGVAVVRGEAGGNTHLLIGDGPITWRSIRNGGLDLGVIHVPEGATAWLAHPEHGYLGIGPGCYITRRQREQADEIRVVAD